MTLSRSARTVRIALGLAAMLIAAGCWDRVEVNDLAIVQGIGLDLEGPGRIRVTASLAVPSAIRPPGATGGSSGQGPAATNKAATGRTVTEALDSMQEKLSRRLFFAHNAVILIGEDLAKEGVTPVMDFFTRHRQTRLRTPIAVTRGRASDVLATTFPIEQNVPVGIQEIERQQLSPFADVRRFLQMLVGDGTEPFTGLVHIVTVGEGVPEPGTLRFPDTNPEIKDPSQPGISGAAVFRGGKLAGFLTADEARGILWARGELRTAITTVSLGEPGKWVGFELVKADSRIEPRVEGDRIVMRVAINLVDDLVENAAGVDTGDPAVIDLLEKALAREVARTVSRAVEKVQKELRSDVLQFGETLRRTHPDVWRRVRDSWDELFPQVEVELQVEAAVLRTGLSTRPLGLRPESVIRLEELRRMLAVE